MWSTLKKLIWLKINAVAAWIWSTVTGVSPLALVNALAGPIKSLTQYGKCVQASTPTPSAPVDIVCNNGVVGMVDDELPSGYTRLSYIESDGTSGSSGGNGYVDTGIFINSTDTDVEIDFQLTDTYAPSPRMAWGYMGTPSSLPRWGFGAYSSKWLGSPNATANAGEVDTDRHVAVMRVYNDGSNSAFYNGTLDGETLYNTNNLGNVSIFEDNDRWPVYLFARNNNNTAANFVPCKIFRFKVYKAGALTHDLVPCKDGNGALGFYDLVAATFSVASGTLIAGAVDYSHSHIGAVGTPEELTAFGQNLVDLTAVTDGYYYGPNGVYTAVSVARLTDYIPVRAGQKYTVYVKAEVSGASATVRCNLFDSAQVWKSQSSFTVTTGAANVGIATPSEDGYLRVSANYTGTGAKADWSALQIVFGEYTVSTMPPYQSYHAPQTVTDIPMLLSVGDITDEDEIISGGVTHRVGIKVFDGSEEWIDGTNGYITVAVQDQSGEAYAPVCTHFRGITSAPGKNSNTIRCYRTTSGDVGRMYFAPDMTTYPTKEDFAAWLAEQYAAGTPVIVFFVLAEETTEQTTPHSLNSYEGTTVVDAQTNVDPVTLSVEYATTS